MTTLPLPMLGRPSPSLAPVKLLNSAVQEHTDPQASLPGAGLTQPLAIVLCVQKQVTASLWAAVASLSIRCEGLSDTAYVKDSFCTWHPVGSRVTGLPFLLGLWAGEAELTSIMFSRASNFEGSSSPAWPWLMAPRR